MNANITFTDEEGNTAEYEVIETTTLGGNTYLLVADADENALILKEDFSGEDEETAVYSEDIKDSEFDAVANIFREMLGEEDIALE